MIEVRELVKRYGDRVAVDHLSFTVDKGCIYGFLGPNGAGKSTTMNIMTGYLSATEGEVLVDGHSMAEEPNAAKACIGYLPELPPLYPDMTVQEYLEFAAGLKGIPKDGRAEQLERILNMTQTDDVADRLIRNLSKGYKQRVGLAQALVGFPDILILDEPTVGLDPKQILEIRTLIRELAQEHTIILSSHILSEVQELCDQIFIIHHGRMVAQGTPAELERELTGAPKLELLVKGTDSEAVGHLLGGVAGIAQAVARPGNEPDTTALELTCAEHADPREGVFRACAAADLPILELKRESMTLEHIFLELTSDTAPVPEEKKKRFARRKKTDEPKAGEMMPEPEQLAGNDGEVGV